VPSRSYKEKFIKEHYYCNFGLNPSYQDLLDKAGLRIVGVDENNEARILEMADHPFFMATLFVPQLSSHPHPVLIAFLEAMAGNVDQSQTSQMLSKAQ
jgi:CTP synthase (UTP-ammonia lyase)